MWMASLYLGVGFLASGPARTPAPSQPQGDLPRECEAEQSLYRVGPQGAWVSETRGLVPLAPVPTPVFQALTNNAGLLWNHPDNGDMWVGKVVSLGDRGEQVFTEFDIGMDHAEFLSSFDQTPATPVWEDPAGSDLTQANVDSAEDNDTHVSLHQIVTAGNQNQRQVVLSKYSSSSATPDWTYTFVPLIGGVSKLAISRDGQVIVAAIQNNFTNQAEVAVFGPSSSNPVSYSYLPYFTQIRGFDLSADGSTLYITSATAAYLFDVATHTVTNSYTLPSALDCHALSGDGSVFAFGGFGFLNVFERNATGGYTLTYTRTVPGTNVCGRIDISDDSSTIAYGFNFYDTNLHVRVEALDLPSQVVTMSDDAFGAGTLQNVVADIAIDEGGERFVVGLWGDEANQCPEVRLYSKHLSTPAALYNLSGSVFDVDISADGERVAVASKAVHANTFAGGGLISLYSFTRQDLRAHGTPIIGSSVGFDLGGPPSSPALLLWSRAAAHTPTFFPGIGTLYLKRDSINVLSMGTTSATGAAHFNFDLSADPGDIGVTLYFQGYVSTPRALTQDWINLTILP